MRTIELFAGTKSFSKVMQLHGIETFTIDSQKSLDADLCCDIREIWQLPYSPDILWASPPCQGFSVAVIGRNWNKDYTPKTPSAELAIELVLKTIELIEKTKPKYWFIENPRGMLRKMPFMEEFLNREGGGVIQYPIANTETRDKSQQISGQTLPGGLPGQCASQGLLATKQHPEDRELEPSESNEQRIGGVFLQHCLRKFYFKCQNKIYE